MVKWLIKAAGLSKEEVQEIASSTNIRLKFPEDLASNSMTKDVLVNFRQQGNHNSLFRKVSRKKSFY